MQSDTSQSQTGKNFTEVREPVVRRKFFTGKSRAGRSGVKGDKVSTLAQKREIIPVNGVTDKGRTEHVQRKQNTKNDFRDFKLTTGEKKQGRNDRKNEETVEIKEKNETTDDEKDKVGVRKGDGDGKTILQKGEEEKKKSWLSKHGPRAARKGTQKANDVKKNVQRTVSNQSFGVEDYLTLLKLLEITLPQGVLNVKVIKHSTESNVIRDAQAIIQDLENFELRFIPNPRLGCREIKHGLNLKEKGDAQKITRIIFFDKPKDLKQTLITNWKKNVSNTSHGFSMRERYRTTPISTPTMYSTAKTRSWKRLEPGKNMAKITCGVRVPVQKLEKMTFSDESLFRQGQSSQRRFGCFFKNPSDEKECLKFFHEESEIKSNYDKLTYTKGNKVEFGFLTGNLDFLAEAKQTQDSAKGKALITSHKENIIIECKGTMGDMVGKLFTKPESGSCKAQFIDTHEYCYQTQAYMYILRKVKPPPTTVRAVMVVRHYHSDSKRARDFYWNYLSEDHTQQIDELRVYCQEEVLARFLAVLSLVFQKETEISEKK